MDLLFISSTVSDGNMSLKRGDSKIALENKLNFFKKLGVDPDKTFGVDQQHTSKIVVVKRLLDNFEDTEADGLVTNLKNCYLYIKTADCHGIALFDPEKEAIGLIHAGRIGLEKGILKKAIKKMKDNFKSNPKNILAVFAPSIGPCCYGPADPQKVSLKNKEYLVEKNGLFYGDIWQWAKDQLTEAGLKKNNIDQPSICTYHDPNYYSHRQAVQENSKDDFRFITVLGMK
jgi:polyphenol oxidase